MDRILVLTPIPSIVLDSSFHIVQVSASYLAISKFRSEDCLGLSIYEFVEVSVLLPDVASVRHAIQTAVAVKDIHIMDGIRAADHYWRVRTIPIFDEDKLLYVVLEAQDTTEEYSKRQALNEQLYASETYRILVNTVKDYAIFMLDPTGLVTTWNAGAAILKQYTQQEIIGQHFSVFYGEEDRTAKKPERELEMCLREGKVEDEGWRYRKDGSRFWANVTIAPVYRSNVLIGFSKVTRDLTERKAAEARLIAAFEEASKLKSDFLANMSHEIRTPMHGMLTALTLLIDTGLNAEQLEFAGIIEESGSTLLQVINDILDYSKLVSGSFTINSDVINVSEITASIVRCYQTTSISKVRLESIVDPQIPRLAKGDALRYRQILQNIVGNAMKFTEKGYVRIHTTLVSDDDTSYILKTEVTDTGIGIPSYAVNSLFTPFTQFDNSATKRYKGTGLGLSICKSLAELTGGNIGFHPNVDQPGSVFWFTTKLAKLDEKWTIPLPIRPSGPDIRELAPEKQLLLVEDNIINQTMMLKLLKGFGFDRVDIALDGEQCVRLVKQKPLTYRLILMDINMPVLDGVGATMEIRKMGLNIPIIAMTANALKGDEEAYLAKGLDDYIAKPVDRPRLMKVLSTWLK
jgi:osomolarity two-component system, sensor histidine kinase TcsA